MKKGWLLYIHCWPWHSPGNELSLNLGCFWNEEASISHTIHVWYLYLHLPKIQPNVAKYTISTMHGWYGYSHVGTLHISKAYSCTLYNFKTWPLVFQLNHPRVHHGNKLFTQRGQPAWPANFGKLHFCTLAPPILLQWLVRLTHSSQFPQSLRIRNLSSWPLATRTFRSCSADFPKSQRPDPKVGGYMVTANVVTFFEGPKAVNTHTHTAKDPYINK